MKKQFLIAVCGMVLFTPLLIAAQVHHRLIIQEFMADPTPAVALPPYEWVEIKNISKEVISLQNWRLIAGSSASSSFPTYFLAPDSLLILCNTAAQVALSKYGKTLALSSFPSLSNEGEVIALRDPTGKTIHSVSYTTDWYAFPWKAEGGWTLEMINATNPCQEQNNWRASQQVAGGSPGQMNQSSIGAIEPVRPVYAFARDAWSLHLVFNRPLDSTIISRGEWISAYPAIQWQSIRLMPPQYTEAIVMLSQPLLADSIIQLTIKELTNCNGIKEQGFFVIKTGLASPADRGSVILNEILFHPRSSGEEFIECVNNGKKIIAVSDLRIALRNSGGLVGSGYKLAVHPLALLPGQHIAFSRDTHAIRREYLVPATATLQKTNPFVTLPNEEGRIVLLNTQGEILDELSYDESWHFELLQQKEGVSLERLDPNAASQNRNNWHSAASTIGFATPGQKNSQTISNTIPQGNFEINPAVFSPDLDGWEDQCSLVYGNMGSGQVISVSIVDAKGTLVKKLVPRALLSNNGYFSWNGTFESGKQCEAGVYVFIIEQYDLQGRTKTTRLPVTLTYSFKKV